MKLLSDRIGHMRQHQHFADRLITKYQMPSLPMFPISRLIYRKLSNNVHSEEVYHHSMNVQWTNITQMTVIRPLMIRQHYFLRTLAISRAGQSYSENHLYANGTSDNRWIANSPWMALATGAVTHQSLPLNREMHNRYEPSSIVVTPERILQTLGIHEWWNDPAGVAHDIDNEARSYDVEIDDNQVLHEYREIQRIEEQQFARLRSGSRQTSSSRPSRKMILSMPSLLSRRLPMIRLLLPAPSPTIRNEWQRRSEEMGRLARIFNVTELSNMDQVLGSNHTINLLTILPPPEWISSIAMPPIWQQRRSEPIRDSEDWLYHIVRLFNPSERRAVIEQNIRKLYIKASERSLHQNARQWSQTVLSTVWHEMSRTSSTHLPAKSPFVRKAGKWMFDPQIAVSILGSRNDTWNSLLHMPWLRNKPSDQTIQQHIYHPVMIRRYLSDPEHWNRGSSEGVPVWQDRMYSTINQYMNIEADRFSQQYVSQALTSWIPSYRNTYQNHWNPMLLLQYSNIGNIGVNRTSNTSLFHGNKISDRQSILHPFANRHRTDTNVAYQQTEQETGTVLQMITKRLPTILSAQSPLVSAIKQHATTRTTDDTNIDWRQPSGSSATVDPLVETVTSAEIQNIRNDLEHQLLHSGRTRIQPTEFNRLVDRVYRELQRKLKFDYQRRGM
ncbi:hypothetical protein [Paenibacillus kyungheensis]